MFMKRFLAVLLGLILVFSAATAEVDLASMSNEELLSLMSEAKNELISRNATEASKVFIVDQDNVKIYLTGNNYVKSGELRIEVVFINNTDKSLSVLSNGFVVNGWEISYPGIISETSPGAKNKDTFEVKMEDAEMSDITELESIQFSLRTFESSSKKSVDLETATVLFSEDGMTLVK